MIRIGFNSSAAAALLAVAGCTNDSSVGNDAPVREPSASIPDTTSESPTGRADAEELQDTLASGELAVLRAEAETLLATNEADLEQSRRVRIVRRGDERLPVTMDLLPGRMNVELDDHAGSYVVTRVVVETSDGEIVVE